ncbi:MFS general substrate transporter, partial [Neoconidiobolus thromboides FSU 785]
PDGGYGWLIVVASFLMQACSFGVAAGFGVFVEFYYTNVFKGAKYSEISLIGTIAPTTMAFASIITGRLCDIFGFRACALSGAALITLSYLLASFSTEIWHLVITQGFIFGLGGGLVYVPANTIITHWFDKHRGLATGIGTAGSGIGGMVFSLLNAKLLPYSGYQWTLRYNAFIFLACLTFSALVIKPYLNEDKHIKRERAPLRKEMVLNGRFILFGLSTTFAAFGYLVPLYFISPYSTFIGLSASQGAILVAILNTSNAVGRIVLGVVGDRFGHFEVYTLCLLLSTLILVIWRFAFTFPVLLVFAILYGFPAGGFAGGFPTACAALFGKILNLDINNSLIF